MLNRETLAARRLPPTQTNGQRHGCRLANIKALAAPARRRETAASCSSAVAARQIHWVNTPVLIEAMERHRQGLLPRSMQLWVQQLLELPPGSPPPERPQGPQH